jgi:hypothetical protein
MDLTRRLRSLLADPRHAVVGAVAVMALVLVAVGVHVLCSVHLDEHPHEAGAADGVVAQHGAHGTEGSHVEVAAAAAGPLDHHAHGCSEHGAVSAQWDPVRPLPQGPAVVPVLAAQWPVPVMVHHDKRVPSGVAVASAPSLHALGISRT